jgi:hypothetical protein
MNKERPLHILYEQLESFLPKIEEKYIGEYELTAEQANTIKQTFVDCYGLSPDSIRIKKGKGKTVDVFLNVPREVKRLEFMFNIIPQKWADKISTENLIVSKEPHDK